MKQCFKIQFDNSLPHVKGFQSDIGREVLNNAFYAFSNKSKATANKTYKPDVLLSTKKLTRPGTGLGLSFSYDIIKVHGLEITISSKKVKVQSIPLQSLHSIQNL